MREANSAVSSLQQAAETSECAFGKSHLATWRLGDLALVVVSETHPWSTGEYANYQLDFCSRPC